MGLHMDKCEELGISWPPPIPEDLNLNDNAWLAVAPPREREIVYISALENGVKWVDSSQTITRCRNSEKTSAPTVLPGCHLWNYEAARYMCGRDLLRLQGYPFEALRNAAKWSDHQLADLAGNSFAVTVSAALDIALLMSVIQVEPGPPDDVLRFIGGRGSSVEPVAGHEAAEESEEADAAMEFDL